jgi:superfamily II DNA/RNA helicase
MIDPETWAKTIVEHLERRGVVGVLLPEDASSANDRFVPRRAIVKYGWAGDTSADTIISFKILAPKNQDFVTHDKSDYRVRTLLSPDWGDEWEDVVIEIPGGSLLKKSIVIDEANRFRIGIRIEDKPDGSGYSRYIILENLRQRNGFIHAIRITQTNLPALRALRPYGIDEDIYYRASGLIGLLDDSKTRLDFVPCALLPEKVRRPRQGLTIDESIQQGLLSTHTAELFQNKGYPNLYKFQEKSMSEIGRWFDNGPEAAAILLTVGTAAGKTEAFLMPLLDRLSEDRLYLGVQGLFVYPTKALQADQARRFFEYSARFNEGRINKISIGVLNGDTPFDIDTLSQLEKRGEFRSPFSKCPASGCDGQIMFTIDANGKNLYSAPLCANCGTDFPWLRIHQRQIKDNYPHILLITPDTLHRQVSNTFAWQGQAMFGRQVHVCQHCGMCIPASTKTLRGEKPCGCNEPLSAPVSLCPSIIVFDEAHLLKGMFGSQVALLISRIRNIALQHGHRPVMIGASATIASPHEFGKQLFGGTVKIIEGEEELTDESPTRYHLFFMPVKVSVLNAVGHTLTGGFIADRDADETNRVLLFSDAKRTVYQLQSTLPEFYATETSSFIEELFCKTDSHTGDLSPEKRRSVEIAFDRCEIRVLLATQTLEVGVDFENLHLELQTGATYSYNDYIQRVGRAGRKGASALVICILRPQVPLDNYYYEHCRELVRFSEHTLDEIPLRSDNPFLIERHIPAAIQDYLIGLEEGAKLMWFVSNAVKALRDNAVQVRSYLAEVFIPPHALEPDLITGVIDDGIREIISHLGANTNSNAKTSELLKEHIQLSIRSTDVDIPVYSDDFEQHMGISLSEEISDEDSDEPPDYDEEVVEQ